MKNKTKKTMISRIRIGSIWSYELQNGALIARLFGVVPLRKISLNKIDYLRLASKEEISPIKLLFSWHRFTNRNRSASPLYLLKAESTRLFIPINGKSHFALRQAIAEKKRAA